MSNQFTPKGNYAKFSDMPPNDFLSTLSSSHRAKVLQVTKQLEDAAATAKLDLIWYLGSVNFIARNKLVPALSVTIVFGGNGPRAGHIELELYIYKEHQADDDAMPPAAWRVEVEFGVSCECTFDHGIHSVEQHEWEAYAPDTLAEALKPAVSTFVEIMNKVEPAHTYRERLGLPND
ncbi:MAG TPA: hypothetical protein VLE99_04925 [Candidatus Saccharimonadales bacterium]|nr:hypothetical protein [Candidatus Saccharimonadales bacterium]